MAEYTRSLLNLRAGLVLALLTLLFGFGLGAAFGAAEDSLKGFLDEEGRAVLETVYGGDEAKMIAVRDKAWAYFKRSHLHANGMGTSALAMILLVAALPGKGGVKWASASALGAGALGYSVFWLLAGAWAPRMGSTGAAKEALEWLAVPSSGVFIAATVVVLVMAISARPGTAERAG